MRTLFRHLCTARSQNVLIVPVIIGPRYRVLIVFVCIFFLRRLRWHVARFIYGSYTVRQIFTNCDLSFVLSASPWPWNLGTCERTGARFSSPQFLRTSLKPTCDVALVHKNHKKRSKQEKSSRHLRRLSCSAKEKHVDLGLHNCFSGAIFVDFESGWVREVLCKEFNDF